MPERASRAGQPFAGRQADQRTHYDRRKTDDETTTEKVRSYVTDPLKVRRNDPGRPRKTELAETLNAFLHPVRTRRASFDRTAVEAILGDGNEHARTVAPETMRALRSALSLRDQ